MKIKKEKLSDRDSLEIRQILVDDDRETIKNSLLEDERRKHEVVEKALDMLASEGIYAYLYADIPHKDVLPGIPTIYQFNTLQAMLKYDEDGKRTEESTDKNAFFHSALWRSLVDTIIFSNNGSKAVGIDKLDPREPDTHTKRMSFMMYYITECYKDYQDRCLEIYDNPV